MENPEVLSSESPNSLVFYDENNQEVDYKSLIAKMHIRWSDCHDDRQLGGLEQEHVELE